MKIKRLETLGFKSFAEKTSFHFLPGVTAIVGPNGCGKSNVVDAIKWVLGEQGVKPLRGKAMEDVIFNGSERRKPLGMAEVCLTLSNEDGLAPQEYADLSEIEVKRRLYRSGESEYYINNTPCRLKDITELFMDTGIGSKSYSIVEQGHIEWLISSRPEERRFLIEEAAGIHKYKVRKDTALRKLEATKQNFLRLKDIIYEVKRQIGTINRQAKKAQAFKSLKEEAKGIELTLIADELRGLKEEKERLEREFKSYKEIEVTSVTSVSKKEEEVEGKRLLLIEKEAEIKRLQMNLLKKEDEVKGTEKEIEINELKLENLRLSIDRMKGEIDELLLKKKTVVERNDLLKEEEGEILLKIKVIEKEIKDYEDSLKSLQCRLAPVYERIEERKRMLVGHLTSLAYAKNSLSNCEEEKKRFLKGLKRIEEERKGLKLRLDTIESKIDSYSSSLVEMEKKRSSAAKEVEEILKEIESLKPKRDEKKKELEGLKERLTGVSTRLSALMEAGELKEGAMKILTHTEKGLKGIHRQVADIFDAEPEFDRALEAVLGERLKGIIVESYEDGVKAVEYLKKEGLGRGSFIPMRLRGRVKGSYGNNPEPPTLKYISSGKTPLLSKVKVKEGYTSVAQYLLGDVIIARDLESALNLWMADGIDKTIVTLDGDVIDLTGIITGGNANGLDRGILKKRREIDRLSKEETSLIGKEAALTEEIAGLEKRLCLITERLETLKEEIHKSEIEMVSLKGECKSLSEEKASLNRREEVLALEEVQLRDDLRLTEENYTALLEEKRLLEERIKREEEFIEAEGESIKRFSLEKEGIEKRLAENRIALVSLKGRLEALKMGFKTNQAELIDIDSKIRERRERIEKGDEEQRSLLTSIKTLKEKLMENISLLNVLKGEKKALEEEYIVYRDELKSLEDCIRIEKKNLNALQANISKISFDIKELNLKINHLLEKARERYDIDEDGLMNYSRHITQDYDKIELRKRLDILRERLKDYVDVNLSAIEELKELEERYSFLTSQYEDLNKSIIALQRVIQRINRVSKERFLKTFNEVNKRFQEIYARFFDGGRAELKLLEEENPLETGIDIVAQPKGKRLQSITLLSGGEKALTVLALIFALFLVKPSPFFLLDEADAPLDDSNTLRFINLIRELSHKSQFILITHNKKTMEAADTLYGITMAEPGVSKILSVKLKEIL